MTKWEYGYANYDGGLLEAGGLPGMSGSETSVGPFLKEAGEKGWELCGVIPAPGPQPGTGGSAVLSLIFKRPI